ncbi:MAG: hypothetical protein AB1489_05455 [Acidobacteriota bacterium]
MSLKNLLLIFLLVTISVVGCRAPANGEKPVNNNQPSPAKSESTPGKKTVTGTLDDEKILKLLYGNYNAKEKRAEWKPTEEDLNKFEWPSEIDTAYTSVGLAVNFQQGGSERFLVITQTAPPEIISHASGGIVGGALFTKVGDAWQLDLDQKYIDQMGGYNAAPEGNLVKIGPDKYGVLFRPGFTNQGYTVESLVIISEIDKQFREIALVEEIYQDNEGSCGGDLGECWKYDSKIEFVPGSNPLYFDLKVTTSGTKQSDDKVINFNEVRTYRFQNGKYETTK